MEKNNKPWCVYKHTAPNGKIYIGITSQSLNRRWRNGKGYANNVYFNRAINKYGWERFQHEIIKDNLTQDEANKLEEELIVKFKARNPKYGYNIRPGGEAHQLDERTKRKLSKIHQGSTNPSKEVPVLVVNANGIVIDRIDSIKKAARKYRVKEQQIYDGIYKLYYHAGDYFFVPVEQFVEFQNNGIRSQYFLSIQANLSKSFYGFDKTTMQITKYDSIHEASDKTGLSRKYIHNSLEEYREGYSQFVFSYNKDNLYSKAYGGLKYRCVKEIDRQGNIYRIYSSIQEAARTNNISTSRIRDYCNNKKIISDDMDFYWQYMTI